MAGCAWDGMDDMDDRVATRERRGGSSSVGEALLADQRAAKRFDEMRRGPCGGSSRVGGVDATDADTADTFRAQHYPLPSLPSTMHRQPATSSQHTRVSVRT
jgi:hypothetical protein